MSLAVLLQSAASSPPQDWTAGLVEAGVVFGFVMVVALCYVLSVRDNAGGSEANGI